jgi:hypothetical protein
LCKIEETLSMEGYLEKILDFIVGWKEEIWKIIKLKFDIYRFYFHQCYYFYLLYVEMKDDKLLIESNKEGQI